MFRVDQLDFRGQSTAFKWYSAGCRTLGDLTAGNGGVKLSPIQEIGIRFYDGQRSIIRQTGTTLTLSSLPLSPDINDRMPRDEAKAIFDLIKPIGDVAQWV
jgi:DNA polymerase lambda